MAEVFVSYSRKDMIFARRLVDALNQHERDAWIDWESIPYSTEWWAEICAGIDSSNVFVFIISPDSLASPICNQEIDHARRSSKRMIPILHREIDERSLAGIWFNQEWENTARDNWAALKKINWLFFRDGDDFDTAFQNLLATADQDPEHVRIHTRLLVRAREWDTKGRDGSLLLRGNDLREAEAWLTFNREKNPPPTVLQSEYIQSSVEQRQREEAAAKRQADRLRVLVVVLSLLLIVAAGASALAVNRQQIADASALTSDANARIAADNADAATIAQGEALNSAGTSDANAARATIAQGEALDSAATSAANAATAVAAEEQAEQNAREANSQALAANALRLFQLGDLDLGIALAIAANNIETPSIQAQRALYQAALNIGTRLIIPVERVISVGFSQVRSDSTANSTFYLRDGRLLHDAGGNLVFIDPQTGAELQRFRTNADLFSKMALHPDERSVFGAGIDNDEIGLMAGETDFEKLFRVQAITRYDLQTGREIQRYEGYPTEPVEGSFTENWIRNLVVSPDGSRLYAMQLFSNTLYEWDVESGELLREIDSGMSPTSTIEILPDGKSILMTGVENVGGDSLGRLKRIDLETLDVRYSVGEQSGWMGISRDGRYAATFAVDGIRVWDTADGTLIQSIPLSLNQGYIVNVVQFSPDGRWLATAAGNGEVVIWDWQAGERLYDLNGHIGSAVNAMAFSPDGRALYTAANDNTLRFWSLDNAESLGTLLLKEQDTFQFTDDRIVAYRLNGDSLLRLDPQTDAVLAEMPLDVAYQQLQSVSPDGQKGIFSSNGGEVVIVDLTTGRALFSLPSGTTLSFSSDSRYLLRTDLTENALLDSTTGDAIYSKQTEESTLVAVMGILGIPSVNALSSDGMTALVGHSTGQIALYRWPDWEVVRLFQSGTTPEVVGAAFSPDGRHAITASVSGQVTLWDVASGEALFNYSGHKGLGLQLVLSPDGHTAISTVVLIGSVEAKLWQVPDYAALIPWLYQNRAVRELTCDERERYNVEPGCRLTGFYPTSTPYPTAAAAPVNYLATEAASALPSPTLAPSPTLEPTAEATLSARMGNVYAAQFSPDDTRILTNSDDAAVRLWDVETGEMLLGLPGYITWPPRWSRDGSQFAVLNIPNIAHIYDTVTLERVLTLEGHTAPLNGMFWSPDGSRILTASMDHTARVWDAQTGVELLALIGHTDEVSYARWSPDGSRILTDGADGNIVVWDAQSGEDLVLIGGAATRGLLVAYDTRWSPDNTRVAVGLQVNPFYPSEIGSGGVWDAQTGEILFSFGNIGDLYGLAWSPDGSRIVTNSGAAARVWDAASGEMLFELSEPVNMFTATPFNNNSSRLMSVREGQVFIWDAANGDKLHQWEIDGEIMTALWSSDGSRLAVSTEEGFVDILNAETGEQVQRLE